MNPNGTSPCVHVVDDSATYRMALGRLLSAAGYTTRSYGSADEFLRMRAPRTLDCAVIDLQLPGMNGLALQAVLMREAHPLPVIFLTGHGRLPDGVSALKAGAIDFLTKPVAASVLLAAVQRAFEQDRRQRTLQEQREKWSAHHATLTPRERQVLLQVVAGRTNREAAGALGTSERTIKAHRAQVMTKMQAGSLAGLVLVAEKLGLLSHTDKA